MAIKKWFVLLGLTFWGLTSCWSTSISSTSTVAVGSSTNTPQPTNTFPPTSTPTPTFTSAPPTPTITPPDVITKYLENVHIVKIDTFDEPSGWSLNSEVAEISDGLLKLIGKSGEVWSGASYLKTTFKEGEGIVINFKFTQGELFEIYLNDGAWATNSYKRFGIYLDRGDAYPNFITGEEGLDFNHLPGNLYPKPDRWYSLFMVIGKGGDFLALIWDTANPEKVIRYREKVEKWKELTWTFHIQVNERMIVFDNFKEIEFDGIK